MNDFWNERYSTDTYAYGLSPNEFFKTELEKIEPGKILLPGEGEGRNAVYAASQGFDVFAFDASDVAREKALKLASEREVIINYKLANLKDATYPENTFYVAALIFVHMPPDLRTRIHRKIVRYLKPGGKLILIAFSKEQLKFNSGGPLNLDMLYSEAELKSDFEGFAEYSIENRIIPLNEGKYHKGKASVLTLTGARNTS